MRPMLSVPMLVALSLLTACSSGNVRSEGDSPRLVAPAISMPAYDPYAAYHAANATTAPPIADRGGTIVKPHEPATSLDRPDYEMAPWATGASSAGATGLGDF
jgi:hypothetical protein